MLFNNIFNVNNVINGKQSINGMNRFSKSQLGFSMIEVPVSLIVLGVGMLGMSGLQIASMKGSSNAHSRNVASMPAFRSKDEYYILKTIIEIADEDLKRLFKVYTTTINLENVSDGVLL